MNTFTLDDPKPPEGSIKLICGGKTAIEIMPDGRFLVHGREAGMDRDVFFAFREFLKASGLLK